MALVIAGDRSGVGKTTVTLMMLAALARQSQYRQRVQSFKVGPDYIDPMFHHRVTGRACRNLDVVLTSAAYVQQCFAYHSQGAKAVVIEGVMGLFDGAGGTDQGSTAHVARLLQVPVVLVLDCGGLSNSIAALVQGYHTFDPRVQLAGVILNRVASDRHLDLLKTALEPLEIPIFGVVPRQDDIGLPARHLGLVPTDEIPQLPLIIKKLAHLGGTCFDWERLHRLLLPIVNPRIIPPEANIPPSVRIGVAWDRAFSFYYQDNLDLLKGLGADLVFWSPLMDSLPPGLQGLYFGGGFPEMFAAELATNEVTRRSVAHAIRDGVPTYAECGGLMYLCEQLVDFDGDAWPMVGIFPTTGQMSPGLTLGYRQAIAVRGSPWLHSGEILWGHEFHRSHLLERPSLPLFELRSFANQKPLGWEGWLAYQVQASYIHFHWGIYPEIPARFLHCCQRARIDYWTGCH